MEEKLQKIQAWASHGSLAQFQREVTGRISDEGFVAELEDDKLSFFKTHKEGGFLGVFAKTIKEVVLEIVRTDGDIVLSKQTANEEFVNLLAGSLGDH